MLSHLKTLWKRPCCEPYFVASMSRQVIPDLIRGLTSINAVSRRKMAAFWSSNRKKGRVIPSFLYSKEEIAVNMEGALLRSGPPPDSHAIMQSYNHELQHRYRRVSLEKEVLVNTGVHAPLRNKRTMTDLGISVLHTAPGVNRRSLGRHLEGNYQLPDVCHEWLEEHVYP